MCSHKFSARAIMDSSSTQRMVVLVTTSTNANITTVAASKFAPTSKAHLSAVASPGSRSTFSMAVAALISTSVKIRPLLNSAPMVVRIPTVLTDVCRRTMTRKMRMMKKLCQNLTCLRHPQRKRFKSKRSPKMKFCQLNTTMRTRTRTTTTRKMTDWTMSCCHFRLHRKRRKSIDQRLKIG
uniref:(northern house mosquito) hypothetical protein n=1 Tax=Culex pipiens TaxID=7175 RepID=A0A8D8I8H7_CULPI